MSKDNDALPQRDEDIQTLLDNHVESRDDDPDVRAYRRVYQALGSSSAGLPASFSDQVLRKILAQQTANSGTNALVISTLLSLLAGAAGLGTVALISWLGYTSLMPEIEQIAALLTSAGVVYIALPVLILMTLDGLIERLGRDPVMR